MVMNPVLTRNNANNVRRIDVAFGMRTCFPTANGSFNGMSVSGAIVDLGIADLSAQRGGEIRTVPQAAVHLIIEDLIRRGVIFVDSHC